MRMEAQDIRVVREPGPWHAWVGVGSWSVPDTEKPNKYAVTLEELEGQVRIPFEDQVTGQPGVAGTNPETWWDEQRRQLRLAGGA